MAVSGVFGTWEVLNGLGVDGVGGIFSFCFAFFLFCFAFLRLSSLFFVFLRFLRLSPRTRANDCNLLGKWGISLRPRLHRPRSELPDLREFWRKVPGEFREMARRVLPNRKML